MTQHNHNLSLKQQGKDVALLQSQLATMEYAIVPSEILGERFAESTLWAETHFRMTVKHRAKDTYRFEGTWQRNQSTQRKKKIDLADLGLAS
jgi:hypothetical protein